MDWFSARHLFVKFAIDRAVTFLLVAILLYFNNIKRSTTYQQVILTISAIVVAISIQIMIMDLGGYTSSYYAGLNITTIAVLGFNPVTMGYSLLIVAAIHVIYFLPIVIRNNMTDVSIFITHNLFMVLTSLIILAVRYLATKTTLSELSLRYDLNVQKHELENLVKKRTKDLEKSEKWHRELFKNSSFGVLVLDRYCRIIDANQKAAEIHGFDAKQLVDIKINVLASENNHNDYAKLAKSSDIGKVVEFEAVHYKKDGSRLDVAVSAKSTIIDNEYFIQVFLNDITDKKAMQEHIFESRKMDSIGHLAGGVAHDFRNIIHAMLGYLEFFRLDIIPREKMLLRSATLEKTLRDALSLIKQMLSFARQDGRVKVPININNMLTESIKLFELSLMNPGSTNEITVEVDLCTQEELIFMGDMGNIKNVLLNLLNNAKDAIDSNSNGTITISSDVVYKSQRKDAPSYLPVKDYIVIKIQDTGCGIPEENLAKIFDPFFTTKKRGAGTGIGLSMAYGVITQHNGFITVDSVLKRGTTFTIYLPIEDSLPNIISTGPDTDSVTIMNQPKNTATVLVVDDVESVLLNAVDILESYGYQVLSTSSPLSALALFEQSMDNIDCVLTDGKMALVDGIELAKLLKDKKPSIKIIMMSAYSKFESHDDVVFDHFLKKPFTTQELGQSINAVLNKNTFLGSNDPIV